MSCIHSRVEMAFALGFTKAPLRERDAAYDHHKQVVEVMGHTACDLP
jgi:hypothetical protein